MHEKLHTQMPASAGFDPSAIVQGENCLGIVRTCGYFPACANFSTCWEASRSASIWVEVTTDRKTTKPSRSRERSIGDSGMRAIVRRFRKDAKFLVAQGQYAPGLVAQLYFPGIQTDLKESTPQ
jgi:hypothetical protein